MRERLQKACEEHIPMQDNGGINAISQRDAEFMDALIDIVSKISTNEDLLGILQRYKSVPDKEVSEDLAFFNENFEGSGENKKVFVSINDISLPVDLIQTIEEVDGYDNEAGMPTYNVLINRTENMYLKLANKQIEFSSPEERSSAINKLKQKIEDTGRIKFL